MKLENLASIEIIPPYMQDDVTVRGLCAAADIILKRLFECIIRMDFYENLDKLNEADLDYMAATIDIPWYNQSDSKDIKIGIIRNSDEIFWYLGTTYAVEKVISSIFGECEVVEWFSYDGDPFHFKINTSNPQISENMIDLFNNVIKNVKRKSAILDAVEITLTAFMQLNEGFIMHTGDSLILTQEG